jgi:hypothetical protein
MHAPRPEPLIPQTEHRPSGGQSAGPTLWSRNGRVIAGSPRTSKGDVLRMLTAAGLDPSAIRTCGLGSVGITRTSTAVYFLDFSAKNIYFKTGLCVICRFDLRSIVNDPLSSGRLILLLWVWDPLTVVCISLNTAQFGVNLINGNTRLRKRDLSYGRRKLLEHLDSRVRGFGDLRIQAFKEGGSRKAQPEFRHLFLASTAVVGHRHSRRRRIKFVITGDHAQLLRHPQLSGTEARHGPESKKVAPPRDCLRDHT